MCYVYAYASIRTNRHGAESAIAALALSTLLILAPGGVYSPMANALFWLSLGILGILKLEARQKNLRRISYQSPGGRATW